MPSKRKFKPPAVVAVTVHRNGAELHAEVKWEDAQLVLQAFLDVYRNAVKLYPELIVELPPVGGGSIPYQDDWSGSEERKRRIGF